MRRRPRTSPRRASRPSPASRCRSTSARRRFDVARRNAFACHTASDFEVTTVPDFLQTDAGFRAALDCDVIACCVDRPWPRHILNALAYAHLIPVVDGGIIARVKDGRLLHVDWRAHVVGPGHACMYCIGALRRSDVALDREGRLDDPDYINGLTPEEREHYAGRNMYSFSMSVAAAEFQKLAGLVTGQKRVAGAGPQTYHLYPGIMETSDKHACDAECDVAETLAKPNHDIVR